MTAHNPLDAAQLEERMDIYLDPALSSRRTAAGPARELTGFARCEQDFVLHWGTVIARDNAELVYQFTAFAARAIRLMDLESVTSWLLYAMDLYDKKGQMPAIRASQDVAEFAANMQEKLAGTVLEDVSGVLERFVCGLNGRPLAIAPDERCFADTESIFLPQVVGRLPDKDDNFRLYKAMTVHQWAQNWYGTWRAGALLEAVAAALSNPSARVSDSLVLIARLAECSVPACCYRGELRPGAVRVCLEVRAALERDRFRVALATLIEEQDGIPSARSGKRRRPYPKPARGCRWHFIRFPGEATPATHRAEPAC